MKILDRLFRRPSNPVAPKEPFADVAPHIVYPEVRAWILDPPGMLDETVEGQRGTVPWAKHICEDVDDAMRQRWCGKKYVYIHDFTKGAGCDFEALKMLLEWGVKSLREGCVGAIVCIVGPQTPYEVRAAAHAGTVTLRVFGVPMEISTNRDETLRKFGVRPASMPQTGQQNAQTTAPNTK
jgi:hypothetical protein